MSRLVVLPYAPRRWAQRFHDSFKRFAALVLHRRAGKTTAVINHHIRAATDDEWERTRLLHLKPALTAPHIETLLRARQYGHIMPTYKQAELVAWGMLKHYADPFYGRRFNEQKLRVTFKGGHVIQLFGADDPDSLRGPGWSGVSFDEYSQQPPNLFGEVISKALADHLGFAIFCGTIKGTDHLFKTHAVAAASLAWFALWQTIETSLATEDDVTTILLEQAMLDDRDLILKGLMTQADYDQEWYLSPDAAIRGAFFARQLADARDKGRICRVPYDESLPVDTDWDLGVDDSTAIWFSQSLRSGEIHLIDFYEAEGEGLPHFKKVLNDKPYVYGEHWGPHDIKVREWGSGGKTRLEQARKLGIRFKVTKNIGFSDGISAARAILSKCWFDEEKCAVGLHGLRNYRKKWNAAMNEFTGTHVHNFASHPADAFRGMAVRHHVPDEEVPDEREEEFPGQRRLNDPDAWAR